MEQSAKPESTVLVTGGSGFLGGWCVVDLLRRGYRVRTTIRDRSREEEVRAMVAREAEMHDRLAVFAADLLDDGGWDAAVEGCEYVLHVASPFPPSAPKDPDELIVPAREGTRRVLRAAIKAGVRRVVVTSSSATVADAPEPRPNPITEDVWTDLSHARPYVQSKVLAERAAWDFMADQGATDRLATVLPSAILGPVLSPDLSYSVQAVERLLNRSMPGIPRLGFSFVDVRDVADLHARAMSAPEGAGERFLGTGASLWLSDVARILRVKGVEWRHEEPVDREHGKRRREERGAEARGDGRDKDGGPEEDEDHPPDVRLRRHRQRKRDEHRDDGQRPPAHAVESQIRDHHHGVSPGDSRAPWRPGRVETGGRH